MSRVFAPESTEEKLSSLARYNITKVQYLLASISLIAVIILGYSSITGSSETVKAAKLLSNVESPAASIIFTQRETLVYATRLAQWSNGGISRREVQIARNLLAQRLAVIDRSGRSMGSRADDNYWRALRSADEIVAASPMGVLPESLHPSVNEEVAPLVDEILSQSRDLVVAYQRSIDEELIDNAQRQADRDRLNLIAFYIFIFFGGAFLLLNVRANFRAYRQARILLDKDQEQLSAAMSALTSAEQAVVELQDLNQAKNAFISTVNHELRTPLTSIIGYIDVLREEEIGKLSEEANRYLEVLDRNAQILLHLVESMLSLSKIDAAQGELSTEKVSLQEVIDNSIFVMQPQIEKARISVEVIQDSDLFVQGDTGQLNQVFLNLIGNAVKFSPPDSSIEIELDSHTHSSGLEYARIRITDHGIGIPEEDIERLFTRFFRAKNAVSQQYPGTGLGLAIVQQAVEIHGGEISVTSEIGRGTTFTIEIPQYLSPEDRMILDRRADVLSRAIDSLTHATSENIKEITHELGGAIGFYGFSEESKVLLNFSRRTTIESILEHPEFQSEKERLITLLKNAQKKIGGTTDE